MKFEAGGDLEYQLSQMLNGGLELGENVQGAFLEVELGFGEQEVQHNLGYTPVGFVLVMKQSQGDVWAARASDWNSQSLWLESNVKNLKVRLFVM